MPAISSTRHETDQLKEKGLMLMRGALLGEQCGMLARIADDLAHRAAEILALAAERQISPIEIPSVFRDLVVVPEGSNPHQVCRVEDMLTASRELASFVEEEITPRVCELMGEEYLVFKDKLNFKWPGGGAFAPHQDFPAYDSFKPRSHVTVMLTIDPATPANGCLEFAANYRSLLGHGTDADSSSRKDLGCLFPFDGEAIRRDYVDRMNWRSVSTKPADLVFFDSFVPHRSHINRSDRSRRAMFITYNRAAEGEWRNLYYQAKRDDPTNRMFHHATPTLPVNVRDGAR